MTKAAIGLLTGWQIVFDVQFVLARVEEGVEIIPPREVPLWRTRRQTLFGFVADVAGLLRLGSELLDVAFDAGLVPREFQAQLFVAVGGWNQVLHQIALVVAGVAFQFVRLVRARHFDHAGV